MNLVDIGGAEVEARGQDAVDRPAWSEGADTLGSGAIELLVGGTTRRPVVDLIDVAAVMIGALHLT